jgi:hypothetical protein
MVHGVQSHDPLRLRVYDKEVDQWYIMALDRKGFESEEAVGEFIYRAQTVAFDISINPEEWVESAYQTPTGMIEKDGKLRPAGFRSRVYKGFSLKLLQVSPVLEAEGRDATWLAENPRKLGCAKPAPLAILAGVKDDPEYQAWKKRQEEKPGKLAVTDDEIESAV